MFACFVSYPNSVIVDTNESGEEKERGKRTKSGEKKLTRIQLCTDSFITAFNGLAKICLDHWRFYGLNLRHPVFITKE